MHAMMWFIKWLQKTKRFTTFGGWSNSIIVSMLVKSTHNNSKLLITLIGHNRAFGLNAFMLDVLLTAANSLCIWAAMFGHQNWSFSKHRVCCGLGVQHHSDFHSWQLPGEPWGPQIANLPPVHQWGCGNGKGLPGGALCCSTLRE